MINITTQIFNFSSLFKTVICLTFILGCATSTVLACECANNKPFLEIFSQADLIIVGRVTSYQGLTPSQNAPLAADIEIQRVLKGNNTSEKVRVFGDTGALCRPYINKFPLNTNWVFALNSLSTGASGESQYYISNCGEYSLLVGGGRVSGRINSNQITSVLLTRFLRSLRR